MISPRPSSNACLKVVACCCSTAGHIAPACRRRHSGCPLPTGLRRPVIGCSHRADKGASVNPRGPAAADGSACGHPRGAVAVITTAPATPFMLLIVNLPQ